MTGTVFLLRVAGIVSATGEEIVWSTGPYAGNGTETVVVAMSDVGAISENSLSPLEPVAASGSVTVTLMFSESLIPLTRTELEWPGSDPAPPRLSAPVFPSDVVISLDTAGLSTPQLVWIGGEVMRLTGAIGPDYTVNRGVGALGVARAHFWDEGQPPIVLTRPPTLIGARALLTMSTDGGAEVEVYRGMVVDREPNGSLFALRIGSVLQSLRERSASKYALSIVDGSPTVKIDLDDRLALGDFACRSQWAPDYVRVWCDERWFVCVPTRPSWADFGLVGVLGPILQWGTGDVVYPPEVNPGFSGQGATDDTVTLIEGLFSTALGTPAQTLEAMLTGQWPPGQVCGLAADDIGDLSALDTAYGGGELRPFASSGSEWWPGPDTASQKMADMIGAGLIEPLGCALTTDATGKIIALDWTRALGGETAVVASQLTAAASRTRDAAPVREVTWRDVRALGESSVTFRSDFASQVAGGGRSIARAPGWLQGAGAWLTDRWESILAIWQYPVPAAVIEPFRSVDLQPGQVISLTVPTILGRDGRRGITAMDALVLSIGRRPTTVSRAVTVALTGYTITPGLCRWAPSAVIASAAGSVLTVTMDNGDDADDWFTAGVAVQILDSDGAVRDATVTVASSTSGTVTVTGLGVTPASGDRLALAPGTVAVYPEAGYFARGQRYV